MDSGIKIMRLFIPEIEIIIIKLSDIGYNVQKQKEQVLFGPSERGEPG
jgi:hypothetical protein